VYILLPHMIQARHHLLLKMKKILRILFRVLLGLLVLFGGYLLVLGGMVVWTFQVKLHRWPAYVYSAPFHLRVGDDIRDVRLLERLERLGYVATQELIPPTGEWTERGSQLRVCFAHCPLKGQGIVTGPVQITLDWKSVRSVKLMRSMEEVDHLLIEPELLDVIAAKGCDAELSRPWPGDTADALVVDAILLTEDERFFSHWGIDAASIQRAVKTNIQAGRYVEGASTITQQLMRMMLLSQEKTLWRKCNEVFLAVLADALYSKETILRAYLDRVYLGHWGHYPVRGVNEAARAFFGETSSNLNAAQCALLAAMIKAPNVINPHRNPERARSRRNMVLGLLLKAGKISREEYDQSVESPVKMRRSGASPVKAAAFLAMVKERLARETVWGEKGAERQDLLTSLDAGIQTEAYAQLRQVGKEGHMGHLILANLDTGAIRALVTPTTAKWSGEGGDLETLLPLVVIPGLIPDRKDQVKYTLTSPLFFPGFTGDAITFREAFYEMRAPLIARLTSSLGPSAIISTLKEFGIRCQSRADNAITVEPLEPLRLAQVYALLARLGHATQLHPEVKVIDGSPPETAKPGQAVSVAPSILFLVNHLLKEPESIAVKEGRPDSSWAQPSLFTAKDRAGVWSVAYRSDALLLVRLPGDQVNDKKLKAAMFRLLPPPNVQGGTGLQPPDGVITRKICLESGLLATSVCPHVIREPFLKGSQPVEWCPLPHQ